MFSNRSNLPNFPSQDKDNTTTPLIPVSESRTTSYDVYYYEQVRPHKKKVREIIGTTCAGLRKALRL